MPIPQKAALISVVGESIKVDGTELIESKFGYGCCVGEAVGV